MPQSSSGTMSQNNGIRRSSIRAPKVGHKKSRKGCQTCKQRRVKCDETYPQCNACLRLGLECGYTQRDATPATRSHTPAASSATTTTAVPAPQHSPTSSSNPQTSPPLPPGEPMDDVVTVEHVNAVAVQTPPDAEMEESKQRRILELRLLHHWMLHVSGPFGMTSPPTWKELWNREVPRIALEHENVLYGLYAMSATHLLGRYPKDEALAQARENYWVWTLRKQRAAIADLNESNVDAASFAALLITMNALTMLQDRSMDPYAPPMEWLEVGRGAFSVLPNVENVPAGSRLGVLIETTAPIWQADKKLGNDMRQQYAGVLDRSLPSSDVWDEETTEAYEATLSYIGSFELAVNAGHAADICLRWICMFPFMVPRKFLDLVAERSPRALVTLAHFFAVVQRTNSLQYLGNTSDTPIGKREVCAIDTVLPREWHALMARPLRQVGAG